MLQNNFINRNCFLGIVVVKMNKAVDYIYFYVFSCLNQIKLHKPSYSKETQDLRWAAPLYLQNAACTSQSNETN